MANTFTLELYRPEPVYGVPNGGTTVLPLNGGVTNGVSYQVDDDSDFDLGNSMPEVSEATIPGQYGSTSSFYTKPDRDVKFTLIVGASDVKTLKQGVRTLQSLFEEAIQYETSASRANGIGSVLGSPLLLKYQPDSSVDAVYFVVKYGFVDTSQFNDQIRLLANEVLIPVSLKVSYAAYGNAYWLENLIPNGTFSRGYKYWSVTDGLSVGFNYGSSYNTEGILGNTGWALYSCITKDFDISNGSWHGGRNGVYDPVHAEPYLENGVDHLWSYVPSPSDPPTWARWYAPGAVNTGAGVSDTFNRADSTTSLGNADAPTSPTRTWSNLVGTFGISSNRAYCVTGATGNRARIQTGNDGITSVYFTGQYGNGSINYACPGLIFRCLDSNNYMYCYVDAQYINFGIVKAGTVYFSTIGSLNVPAPADNTTHKLSVTHIGTQINIYVDSIFQATFSTADSALAAFNTATYNGSGLYLYKSGSPTITPYWDNFNYTNDISLTSSGVPICGYSTIQMNTSGPNITQNSKIWFDLEYRDNQTTDTSFATAIVEIQDASTLVWSQFGPAITMGNCPNWTRFAWPAAQSGPNGYLQNGALYSAINIRVRVITNTSKALGKYFDVRKVATWNFPYGLPDSLVQLPKTEYVSQSWEMKDTCVLSGLRGDLETNGRVKVINPPLPNGNSYTMRYYQALDLGLRKQKGVPAPFYFDYGNTTLTLTPASYVNSPYADPSPRIYMPCSDFSSRQYRMILYASTTAPVGVGFVGTVEGYWTATKPSFTAVPNASVTEIPSTSGVMQYINAGTVTIPPYTAASSGLTTRDWAISFTPVRSTGTSPVTIVIGQVFFIPADQMISIDTREQGTYDHDPVWSNAPIGNGYRGIVIDNLLKERGNFYLANAQDGARHLRPAVSSGILRFYPATTTSPEPMLFGSVVRRVGSNGSPATTINLSDTLMYSFLYCPAYEF
jgi:hypothetical protein